MDAYELAGMLFGSKRAESGGSVPYETAVGGTAKSSENGLVLVSMSSDVTVPDDYELQPPEGSEVLLDEHRKTEYASYRVIKYRWASVDLPRPARARRRLRRIPRKD